VQVGDLVKWAGPGYDGPDKGLGSVVDIWEGGLGPKKMSVDVYWPGWGETQWTVVGRLQAINESR